MFSFSASFFHTTHTLIIYTWYVLSKVSYMNRVISDVFPTRRAKRVNTPFQHPPVLQLPLCSPKNTNLYLRWLSEVSAVMVQVERKKRKETKKPKNEIKGRTKKPYHGKKRRGVQLFLNSIKERDNYIICMYYTSQSEAMKRCTVG